MPVSGNMRVRKRCRQIALHRVTSLHSQSTKYALVGPLHGITRDLRHVPELGQF
jgi:hypothetical protein